MTADTAKARSPSNAGWYLKPPRCIDLLDL